MADHLSATDSEEQALELLHTGHHAEADAMFDRLDPYNVVLDVSKQRKQAVDEAVSAHVVYIAAGRHKVQTVRRLDEMGRKEMTQRVKELREIGIDA